MEEISRLARNQGLGRLARRLLEQRDNLLPPHAWKAVQEDFDRVAGPEVVEEALYPYACALKNGFPTEDLWILQDDVAHRRQQSTSIVWG